MEIALQVLLACEPGLGRNAHLLWSGASPGFTAPQGFQDKAGSGREGRGCALPPLHWKALYSQRPRATHSLPRFLFPISF